MATRTYQRRTAGEWAELIERQQASGQSQAAFCAAEGISLSTFTYRKRQLGSSSTRSRNVAAREASAAAPPLFTPLTPAETGEDERGHGWQIDLDLGDGLRLSIRKVA